MYRELCSFSPLHALQGYELGNDVMQHGRHVMCAEGTMSAEKYKALVLYTHCRPMVLDSNIT